MLAHVLILHGGLVVEAKPMFNDPGAEKPIPRLSLSLVSLPFSYFLTKR